MKNEVKDLELRIQDLEKKLKVAVGALSWCYDYFNHRDIMNAMVHCSPVRLSPITEVVLKAHELLSNDD